jgi:hypothetical protein
MGRMPVDRYSRDLPLPAAIVCVLQQLSENNKIIA